jgi:hypothetical protein
MQSVWDQAPMASLSSVFSHPSVEVGHVSEQPWNLLIHASFAYVEILWP